MARSLGPTSSATSTCSMRGRPNVNVYVMVGNLRTFRSRHFVESCFVQESRMLVRRLTINTF